MFTIEQAMENLAFDEDRMRRLQKGRADIVVSFAGSEELEKALYWVDMDIETAARHLRIAARIVAAFDEEEE